MDGLGDKTEVSGETAAYRKLFWRGEMLAHCNKGSNLHRQLFSVFLLHLDTVLHVHAAKIPSVTLAPSVPSHIHAPTQPLVALRHPLYFDSNLSLHSVTLCPTDTACVKLWTVVNT